MTIRSRSGVAHLAALPWLSAMLLLACSIGCSHVAPGPEITGITGETPKNRFAGGTFTEGPAVGEDGAVYFSDQASSGSAGGPRGSIWRFDPMKDTATVVVDSSGMANGLEFDADGTLLAAEGADSGGRRVVRRDLSMGTVTVVADVFGGRRFNSPNDLVVDRAGTIYFSDPRYRGEEPIDQPVSGVYRVYPTGKVDLVVDQLIRPNGLALSPDHRVLYVAEDNYLSSDPALRTRILAYDLGLDGSVAFRSSLYDFSAEGSPDGIAVDHEGFIYVAVYELKAISVHYSDGRKRGLIRLPESPTNVAFGRGASARVLYITAGGGLYSVDLGAP